MCSSVGELGTHVSLGDARAVQPIRCASVVLGLLQVTPRAALSAAGSAAHTPSKGLDRLGRGIYVRRCVLWAAVLSLCAGCATIGSYQAECEKKHAAFPEVVACLKEAVASDSRPEIYKSSPELKLYLLKAEQLSQRVQRGEISDLDARVELQQLYVEMGRSNQQTKASKPQNSGMSFLCKDAIARGDQGAIFVHCQ
jgi:hypothetical protein